MKLLSKKTFLVLCLLLVSITHSFADSKFLSFCFNEVNLEAGVSRCSNDAYGEIVIPSTVTKDDKTYTVTYIVYEAFHDKDGITSVIIPNTVKRINYGAFSYSDNLESVTLGNGLESIEDEAFSYCQSLKEIVLPKSLTTIYGSNAFEGCTSLSSIQVDAENPVFDSRDNCNAIIRTESNELITGCKNTTIPNSVEIIGYKAFYECSTLENITIPHSVTKIENEAFSRTGLSSMIIPNSVTTIHNWVFAYCNNLTEVYIPESVESLGEGNFEHCVNLISATICSKETGFGTFCGCINLTNVELSDNVEKISGSTFYGCKSLETIELGDSITHIHYEAFGECKKLKNITIPQNVRYLGNFVLGGCLSLEYVVSLIDKPVEVRYGERCFDEIFAEPILYVPYGTKELYQIHEQWCGFKEIIEMNPTGISVISDDDCNASSHYSTNGMKTSSSYKGLNIIRMKNGKTRKVMK